MIEINEEIEIDNIKTEKKVVKEEEIEYLIFHFKGKKIAIAIKDEIDHHPLLELQHNGLGIKAQISLSISNPQTTLDKF